jgi:hypothetical protein
MPQAAEKSAPVLNSARRVASSSIQRLPVIVVDTPE